MTIFTIIIACKKITLRNRKYFPTKYNHVITLGNYIFKTKLKIDPTITQINRIQ